jgi:hypothetical protein
MFLGEQFLIFLQIFNDHLWNRDDVSNNIMKTFKIAFTLNLTSIKCFLRHHPYQFTILGNANSTERLTVGT